MITDKNGHLDVIYVNEKGEVWDVENGKIDQKKTKENQKEIKDKLEMTD